MKVAQFNSLFFLLVLATKNLVIGHTIPNTEQKIQQLINLPVCGEVNHKDSMENGITPFVNLGKGNHIYTGYDEYLPKLAQIDLSVSGIKFTDSNKRTTY